jgi:NhaP-type Na+/H+ or K+/H+ antiporter
MHIITIVLVLLLSVIISKFIVQLLPIRLPPPLLQIPIGALLAGMLGFTIKFDPHVFTLVHPPVVVP